MNRHLITKTLFAVSAFALLSGFGGGCGHRRGHMKPERAQRHMTERVNDFIDDVDANESQAKQIRGLAKGLTDRVPNLMKGHKSMKDSLQSAWASPAPEAQPLHDQLDTQLEGVSSALHAVIDAGVELHKILTPEQRAEMGNH